MRTAALIALKSVPLAVDMEPGALRRRLDDLYLRRVDMEPGALRRRLDDIYLHRSELSGIHANMSSNMAETQPMSVEICFRLNIWPLQQLCALLEFHFLCKIDPRNASVDLVYQEHLLQWMTVVDLVTDLIDRMEAQYGGRCDKTTICITAESSRRFEAHESLTILRELADEDSMVSLVAGPSSVGKQMLAEFWLPKLDAKLAAPVLARLDLHCFQVILAWISLCEWYNLCRVNRQWSRWLRASPTFRSVVSDARWAKDPELLSIRREVRANEDLP